MTTIPLPDRPALVRRSQWLNYATMAYNSLEAVIAIGAGVFAGSVALVGFGVDSVIELTASVTALWRLRADHSADRRAHAEARSLRIIGLCFIALAIYVAVEAFRALLDRSAPEASWVGIGLAIASLGVMPYLATSKRRIAFQLRSGALVAEARQTMICTYLSAILLGGLALNAVFGWRWADPVAGLAMVPLIAWEGVEGLRGRSPCADDCHVGPGAA